MAKPAKEDSDEWVVPDENDLNAVWKQVAFVGIEPQHFDLIGAEPWFFAHLDEEIENGTLSQGKPVYLFGSAERLSLLISCLV